MALRKGLQFLIWYSRPRFIKSSYSTRFVPTRNADDHSKPARKEAVQGITQSQNRGVQSQPSAFDSSKDMEGTSGAESEKGKFRPQQLFFILFLLYYKD